MADSASHPIALVTGANRGLGKALSKLLLDAGLTVFVAARSQEKAESTAAELGSKALPLVLDATDTATIEKAAAAFGVQTDHLDVLVNNAGILLDHEEDILTVDTQDFTQTFEVNTMGPLRITRAFLPYLRKSALARVVNVSSGLGTLSDMENYVPTYSVSKVALNGITRQLASRLREEKIIVTSVCPGWCRTDMGGANATRSDEEGARSILWNATQATLEDSGKAFRDGQVLPW